MKTTFVALVGLCAASLVIGCDEDKKTDTAPSAPAASVAVVPAPTPPAKPSPADVIPKVIASDVDAWNAHDGAKVAANYEPTAKLVIPGLPDIVGRDGIAAHAKENFIAYPDFKVAVTKDFIHGNTAAFEWVITGKNDGPSMGQKPTGRQMGVGGASVVAFDDEGLIKEEHRYLDLPTIASQLDAKAKAGTFRAPIALPTGATETRVATDTPDDAKTTEAGKAIYAAFDSKNESRVLALVTDDTVIDDYTTPATMKGTKGAKDYVGGFWKAFPDFTQEYPMRFAAGDTLITEGSFAGTQTGPMGPLKATNKPASMRFVDIMQIKDGKMARVDSFGDSAEILVAVGAMPPMGAAPSTGREMAAATPAPVAKPK
jgi:predicted ester cyclase